MEENIPQHENAVESLKPATSGVFARISHEEKVAIRARNPV
jgi:hypothetical protein